MAGLPDVVAGGADTGNDMVEMAVADAIRPVRLDPDTSRMVVRDPSITGMRTQTDRRRRVRPSPVRVVARSVAFALSPRPQRSGDGWLAFRPAHENARTPALSAGEGCNGELLAFCHAGCQ